MNHINHDYAKLTDTAIAKRAEEASRQLADAEAAARTAGAAANAAEEAFKRSPSAESHAEAAVTKQVATNAVARVAVVKAEVEPVVVEADRRRQLKRLAELRQRMDWPGTMRSTRDRIERLVADFRAEMSSELTAFVRAMGEFNNLTFERESLEATLGAGERCRPLSLNAQIENLAGPLHEKHLDRLVGQPTMRLIGTDQGITVEIKVKFGS